MILTVIYPMLFLRKELWYAFFAAVAAAATRYATAVF